MTTQTPSNKPERALLRHLRPSDLKAAGQLASQATQGVIGITEGVHQAVRRTVGLPAGATPAHTGGLTGQTYRGIRGVAALVGQGSDAALGALLPLLKQPRAEHQATAQRAAVLAALNGVLGDRLVATGNPLAQTMAFRYQGQTLPLEAPEALKSRLGAAASPHLLLLIHGLCMNDAQWLRDGHDHGSYLAPALGATPVYLLYNSGRHVSDNGLALAQGLERLVAAWPVPLQRLTIVGHSMGGLVARSAIHLARQRGQHWPSVLRELVFLGTPHHGAPMERAGHGVELLLGATPFSRPFARLGQVRSAGILDLRHGHVQEADWRSPGGQGWRAGFEDRRVPLPLPEGVACFAVAATLAGQRGLLADRLTGDGLVPLNSALGQHDEARRRLVFAKDSQRIVYRSGHLDLLSSPLVAEQLLSWLVAAPSTNA